MILDKKAWLPITREETELRGWSELDVVLVSGDAYIDHPAFGTTVIGRILEQEGLRVAIVAQPNWQDDLRDFKKFGPPKLFFGVTAGAMDSMVNHYTARKRRRSDDAYTPGGQSGFRPDYASIVYSQILKKLYPDVPVVIGGIEASLRRVTHYDYWSDQLRPGILVDSQADLLVYGMGEQPLREIIRLLRRGVPFSSLKTIPQTAFLQASAEPLPKNKNWADLRLSSHEECLSSKKKYAANFKHIEQESNKQYARRLIQDYADKRLVINPPFPTMTEQEIDASFDLPYTRLPHPKYVKRGVIPAYTMIRHSVNTHRGCFGGCSFCTISAHQGKMIASRSEASILQEVRQVVRMPDFKGYISDLGGPSANMFKMKGKIQEICDRCLSPSCIHPTICHNLNIDHQPMIQLYEKTAKIDGVKKAFVSSGIRYDLLLAKDEKQDRKNHLTEYMEQVIRHNIPGRLKVAPEHTSSETLKLMRKPSFKFFHRFKQKYEAINRKAGLSQPLIPYFISGHPGCGMEDMAELAAETKEMGFQLEQVQDFTPTPMTLATEIYYSGYHPYTMKEYRTARSVQEKKEQSLFFFWYKKENQHWIEKMLTSLGRLDLLNRLLPDWSKAGKNKSGKPTGKNRFPG